MDRLAKFTESGNGKNLANVKKNFECVLSAISPQKSLKQMFDEK